MHALIKTNGKNKLLIYETGSKSCVDFFGSVPRVFLNINLFLFTKLSAERHLEDLSCFLTLTLAYSGKKVVPPRINSFE